MEYKPSSSKGGEAESTGSPLSLNELVFNSEMLQHGFTDIAQKNYYIVIKLYYFILYFLFQKLSSIQQQNLIYCSFPTKSTVSCSFAGSYSTGMTPDGTSTVGVTKDPKTGEQVDLKYIEHFPGFWVIGDTDGIDAPGG